MRVHHGQFLDKRIAAVFEPLVRTRNHWFGNIDAGDFSRRVVVIERQACADSDFENPPAHVSRGPGGGPPAVDEDRPAQNVVDRRPAGVGFFHHLAVRVAQHGPSRIISVVSRKGSNKAVRQLGDTRFGVVTWITAQRHAFTLPSKGEV